MYECQNLIAISLVAQQAAAISICSPPTHTPTPAPTHTPDEGGGREFRNSSGVPLDHHHIKFVGAFTNTRVERHWRGKMPKNTTT